MKISIGLPNAVPGIAGRRLVDWAAAAEQLGFASLGTIGRIVYDNHDELIALAAAAAATERIGLATTVMISPPRDSVLLAKQAATLDDISGGRFTLGVGVGWRDDDYRATGTDYTRRGRLLDEQIATMRTIWTGRSVDGLNPIGPTPTRPGGPELMLGGASDAAIARAGAHADAYIAGPLPVERIATIGDAVTAAAAEHGWPAPRLVASRYVALDADDTEATRAIAAYYSVAGDTMVANTIAGMLRTPDAIISTITDMAGAGIDELFLWPTLGDLDQLHRIAQAALTHPATTTASNTGPRD